MGYSLYGELEIVGDDASLAYAALNIDAFATKHASAIRTRRATVENVMNGIAQQPTRTGDNDLIERLLGFGGYTARVTHNHDGTVGYLAMYEGNMWVGFESTIVYLAESGMSVHGKIRGEDGEAWLYDTPSRTGHLIKHTLKHATEEHLGSLEKDAATMQQIRGYARLDDDAEIGRLVRELLTSDEKS